MSSTTTSATSAAVTYSRTAIVLHWLLAVLILGQIAFGWYLQEIPRGTPPRTIFVNLHKSTGMILGLLILFRSYWRLTHRAPALPGFRPAWERTAAHVSHWALYACMLIMPLSGYIASNFSKYGVNFFNAVKLPPWGPQNPAVYDALNTTHVVTSYFFVALIAVHVLAALRHLVLRDGIFGRMWGGSASSS
jgi:cytochrome b561